MDIESHGILTDPTMGYYTVSYEDIEAGDMDLLLRCYYLPRDIFLYYPNTSECPPLKIPENWKNEVHQLENHGKLWAYVAGLYHTHESDGYDDAAEDPKICSTCLESDKDFLRVLTELRLEWLLTLSGQVPGAPTEQRGKVGENILRRLVRTELRLKELGGRRNQSLARFSDLNLTDYLLFCTGESTPDSDVADMSDLAEEIHKLQHRFRKIGRQILVGASFRSLTYINFLNGSRGLSHSIQAEASEIVMAYEALVTSAEAYKSPLFLADTDIHALKRTRNALQLGIRNSPKFTTAMKEAETHLKSIIDRQESIDLIAFTQKLERHKSLHPWVPLQGITEFAAPLSNAPVESEVRTLGPYHSYSAHQMGHAKTNEDACGTCLLSLLNGEQALLSGVYDGEGSDTCSRFVCDTLPGLLVKEIHAAKPKNSMEMTLLLNQVPASLDKLWNKKIAGTAEKSGSSLLFTLVWKDHLFCVNCGNCRALMVNGDQWKLLSEDANPTQHSYLKKVLQTGGWVKKDSSGVTKICDGKKVARSVGYAKDRGISSTPKIEVVDLADLNKESPLTIVLGTSGMYENNILLSEEVAEYVNGRGCLEKATQELVLHALHRENKGKGKKPSTYRWSNSNVTTVAIRVWDTKTTDDDPWLAFPFG